MKVFYNDKLELDVEFNIGEPTAQNLELMAEMLLLVESGQATDAIITALQKQNKKAADLIEKRIMDLITIANIVAKPNKPVVSALETFSPKGNHDKLE